MADRTFTLKFVGDIADAKKSLQNMEQSVDGFKSTTTTAFKAIGAAVTVGAVVEFGKSVVGAASDTEQALGASQSVFKEYADEIHAFGTTTAENLGIAESEFNQLAATTGALLKNAGVPLDEASASTIELTKRAADMAAMYGGTVPEAMGAMASAFKGEFDPLERYGVSLKASAIEARAVADGMVDAEGKATDYGKAMAAQALIMEQSADAAGTFADEQDTVAGQSAIMSAQFKDLQADIGQKLLPVIVRFAEVLRGIITFVVNNQGWLLPLAAAITAITVAIKGAMIIGTFIDLMKKWEVGTKLAAAAQWLWNAAMSANPIMLIVIAVAAVIAIVVLLYMKVDWFRAAVDAAIDGVVAAWNWLLDIVKGVFNWVKDNWPLLLAIITGPIGIAVHQIVTHWETIKEAVRAAIDWIKQFLSNVWDTISSPFKRGAEIIRLALDDIRKWFRELPGNIAGFLSNVWQTISSPFKLAKDAIWNVIKDVKDWFWALPGQVRGFFNGFTDILTAPFKAAFNAIKWLWNSTVGGFGFTVPSWVPGVGGKGFRIPEMARGGIVTRPTIALIGEAGPEAVVPLGGRGAAFGGVTINVYALTANAEVGRQVYNALREYERTTGKMPA